ncbi:MAG: hypothetical protein C5B59_15670 [Bacteroidetes bacterium]|nr:MAG: hypothetical protein C5B59_15670 [Bacteroidota bacterium]
MTSKQRIKYSTVTEYIAGQPDAIRPKLQQLRETIRKAAPDAEELISYQIPAFKYHGMLIWYAAFTKHLGIYPTKGTVLKFKEKAKPYVSGMATLRFDVDKPLPLKLITEIVKYRIEANLAKEELKASKNNSKTVIAKNKSS